MHDEYGDMEQIAGDFCDWWSERYIHFVMQMVKIKRSLDIEYTFKASHAAKVLFGHDNFISCR